MPQNYASDLYASYAEARRAKVEGERRKENEERDRKLEYYQHIIDRADELGLTQDDMRFIFNDAGKLLGHKPDPKLLGLFQIGDKGDKGKPDLGDMLFPQEKRDKQIITGSRAGTPTTEEGPGRSIEDRIGPPPEMITERKGAVPVRDLNLRAKRQHQILLDQATTQNNIEQANAIASKTIQQAYDSQGNLKFYRQQLDPETNQIKLVDITPEEALKSTQEVVTGIRNNKEFNEQLNLLRNDPKYADLPEEVLRNNAAQMVMQKRKAELEKTQARTDELRASTQLKRARTSDILNPKITPYQAARLGQQQQGLEIQAARTAIAQSAFEKGQSANLVQDLDKFYKARNDALKMIEEGNQSKSKGNLIEADSKWRMGYMMLAQSKAMAAALQSHYQGMVNVANVDPNDANQYPWVEVNFDLPAQQNQGAPVTKQKFTPSKQVAPEMINKYREWLKSKGASPEEIERRVKQYSSGGGQ